MSSHEQVSHLVKTSILHVAKRRQIHGFYRDDWESREAHYFPTLEGLEAILIPAIAVENAKWSTLVSEFPAIRQIVEYDIEYILKGNDARHRSEQGAPYFDTGRGPNRKYYWISECGAFTLSTLINVLTVAKLFPKEAPSFDNSLLRQTIEQNVNDLLACGTPVGGYSWSKGGRTPDAWATWSVVETFTDYLSYADEFGIRFPQIPSVKTSLEKTRDYLLGQLDRTSPTTIAANWFSNVCEKPKVKAHKQVKSLYSFVHTMISSSLLKLEGHKSFRELAALLFESVERLKVKNVENLAKVASKDENIDDYSYHPTLLRALTSIYVEMDSNSRKDLARRLEQSPIHYIKKQYDHLMKEYIVVGDWAGLWGYGGGKYEIYYTERTIEALVSLTEFLKSWRGAARAWQVPKIKKSTRAELQAELEQAIAKMSGVKIR